MMSAEAEVWSGRIQQESSYSSHCLCRRMARPVSVQLPEAVGRLVLRSVCLERHKTGPSSTLTCAVAGATMPSCLVLSDW